MKPKIILFIPAIVWFIITTLLLVLPGPDIPTVSFLDLIYFDKWVHAGLFGGMTFLFSFPYMRNFIASKRLLISVAIICALYGAAMEYVQKYFAFERDFDYYDMIADSVGCIIAYFVSNFLKHKLLKRREAKV